MERRQSAIEDALAEFPLRLEFVVRWGEMDAARHVNNAVYLRWAETLRTEYFRQLGFFHTEDSREGVILGWQDCKYIFPVTFPDTVLAGIRPAEVGSDRFLLECRYYSQKHGRLVAISNHRMVAYDYVDLKKIAVPETWKKLMSI